MRGRADYEGVDVPKVTAAAAALVLVLALAGCGDDGGDASDRNNAADAGADRSTSAPDTPSASPEPLVAESPDTSDPEELFLAEARARLFGLGSATTIPNATDEQLLVAGHEACAALIAETPFTDVSVISGEERVQGSYLDSAAIASAGLLYLCPEMNGKTL